MRLVKVTILLPLAVPNTVPPIVTAEFDVRLHLHWYPVMAIFLSTHLMRVHVIVMLLKVVAVTRRFSGGLVGAEHIFKYASYLVRKKFS